jgi:hypothetical protein
MVCDPRSLVIPSSCFPYAYVTEGTSCRAPRGDAQDGDSSGENEPTDEESSGEEVTPAPGSSSLPTATPEDPAIARAARKARKQQGAHAKKAESDEDEDDADLVNPNRVASKNLKAADLAAPRQLSRRERFVPFTPIPI